MRTIRRFVFVVQSLLGVVVFSGSLQAMEPGITVRRLVHERDGETYAPVVVAPEGARGLPGVLMVPNWMGVSDAAVEQAGRVAAMGYVVYVADLYTAAVRPTGPAEAGVAAGALRADRALMRARTRVALEHFQSLASETGVPDGRYAAIGFCFGGGAVLEFARTGAPLRAFVSFHGDLLSPTLEQDSGKITGSVLVLHGDADPLVPVAHTQAWQAAMRSAVGVDWQFVAYAGAVHSFTDPEAASPGRSAYHPVVAARAYAHMHALLQETLR